jgi:pyrroline-5-carboxylate reductase
VGEGRIEREAPGVPRDAVDSGPNEPELRPARAADVPAISALLAGFARQGMVRDRTVEDVKRDIGGFIVAASGERVVGSVALRIHSPSLYEIASLSVAEGFHGQGLGRRLIQAAVLRAHSRGVRRLFAFTMRVRLFQQLGFHTAPVTDFPQKLATDYGGAAVAAGHKAAVVLDLEAARQTSARRGSAGRRPGAAGAAANDSENFPTERSGSSMNDVERPTRPAIAILGGGNLGRALAMGWTETGYCPADRIRITRRHAEKLTYFAEVGFRVGADNREAVTESDIIVLAVQPQQIAALLEEIGPVIDPARHRIISVVSGVTIRQLREPLDTTAPIVRAMPNTAVSIGESMTCLASQEEGDPALAEAQELFELVGRTLVIPENMMIPATALCACGIAFFLRAIRAASQGGIEIGFHPEEALLLAAQTAKGAASLLLSQGRHPESEIDQVTTPRGCTIAGLNEMEHQGFSSAMIKGILLSATKAEGLYAE